MTSGRFSPLHDALAGLRYRPLIVAHRGDWSAAPENSILAIEAAIASGFSMVEVDVKTTADNRPVLLHDDELDRTTDLQGDLRTFTLTAVRQARLRRGMGGHDARLTSERVPTLEECLETCRGRILLNIDTKYEADFAAITRVALGLRMMDHIVVKAHLATEQDMARIKGLPFWGQIAFMPLLKPPPGQFLLELRRFRPIMESLVEAQVETIEELIASIGFFAENDLHLWVNTLDAFHCADLNDSAAMKNPEKVWGRLIDWGVGAIQTDRPAALKDFIRNGQQQRLR
jgi:glycerophosphoryl diester phosphodiesterase